MSTTEAELIRTRVEFVIPRGVVEGQLQSSAVGSTANVAISGLDPLTNPSFEEGVATIYAYEKGLQR